MIYYPKWREHSPDKWKGKADFVHSTKAKVRTKKRDYGYKKRTVSEFIEPYEDGLNSLGDRIISRDNKLRHNSPQFSSVIPKDPWKNRSINSESLRAEKALEMVFKNQKRNLKMIAGTRLNSPNRMTGQQFINQAGDYKLYTTADKDAVLSNKTRSASTGQAMRVSPPVKAKLNKNLDRKVNTARKSKNDDVQNQNALNSQTRKDNNDLLGTSQNNNILNSANINFQLASSNISLNYHPKLRLKTVHKQSLKNMTRVEQILEDLHSSQYQVVSDFGSTHFKKKEDLTQVHIQQAIDYPKSYYVSAIEKVKRIPKEKKIRNYDSDFPNYDFAPSPMAHIDRYEIVNSKNIHKFKHGQTEKYEITSDNVMQLSDAGESTSRHHQNDLNSNPTEETRGKLDSKSNENTVENEIRSTQMSHKDHKPFTKGKLPSSRMIFCPHMLYVFYRKARTSTHAPQISKCEQARACKKERERPPVTH